MDFINQTVIITGAGNGIGKRVAEAYANAGANVVAADVNIEAVEKLAKSLSSQSIIAIEADVRKEADVNSLMKKAYQTFGRIDILINNAGVSKWKSLFELTIEEWDDIINTNLRSVFLASREAAKYMKENEHGGSIVNLASTRAMMSERDTEAYAASKGGITALTHALAISLSEEQITVNAISPGWIATSGYEELRKKDHAQHPSNRVGTPADIARACFYLTNQMNDFVTGINLVVDGGMTRKMIYEE
ncbi:glucose 1-dehydrogenase [Cytobacillus purgationiresistens]|uniref:NAD(P)-dependent dehydrogenase (Short-subunit alcohol dehydrogenase family) n=1 Tax=Cytobacillus purgationiresistens TaxID=863449 RepID=A0ABU0AEG8_9BACI|nr:glucose 1-dehydrogenase [Cytobacillus purgationiresistens]MDQ0269650.1 NAD(P)-dependent dehydrogenase (short-subunit alcohol dehydrogenase family) [Cytobacillus purgationiresistens]